MPGVTVVRDGDFVGVAAGDPVTARRAVAAIRADWDMPAPGPADLAGYLREHPVAGQGWQRAVRSETGDAEAALAAAATQVKATYTTAYLAHVPLETRAALAEWDDGRLTVCTRAATRSPRVDAERIELVHQLLGVPGKITEGVAVNFAR